jgi:hypothetical protein
LVTSSFAPTRIEQAIALEADRRGALEGEVHADGALQHAETGQHPLMLHLQAALGLPLLEL